MSHLESTKIGVSSWRRILAFFIDYVFVILPYLGLMSLVGGFLRSNETHLFDAIHPVRNQLIVILSLTIPIACYFAVSEASRWQATIGKRVMKLIVVTKEGNPLSLKESFIRVTGKFMMWEYFHTILWHWEGWPTNPQPPTTSQIIAMAIGWLLMTLIFVGIFIGSGRTLYDYISGTLVTTKVIPEETPQSKLNVIFNDKSKT